MIPPIDPATGYIPPGIHTGTWAEIVQHFSSNTHRGLLTNGLLAAVKNLVGAGCTLIVLDGSFVSSKALPNDYDGAWDLHGVDPSKLDSVLLDFSNGRAAMKAKYGGELFPATAQAAPGVRYLDFFQRDRNGTPKGVVSIDLGSLP